MSNKLVKIYLAGAQVFPQTVAESVLVKESQIITLDKVLKRKIEQIDTPEDSGLTSTKNGTIITVDHTNKINPNSTTEAKLIQYDQNGHIVNTEPTKVQTVVVDGNIYTQYDGNKDTITAFGDDFKIENTGISLTWGAN